MEIKKVGGKWGVCSWNDSFKHVEEKSLLQLARKGGDDLQHVVSVLRNKNEPDAELLAEQLFELYSQNYRLHQYIPHTMTQLKGGAGLSPGSQLSGKTNINLWFSMHHFFSILIFFHNIFPTT